MKPDTTGLNKYINQAISAAYDAGFDDGKKAAEEKESEFPYDFKPGDILEPKESGHLIEGSQLIVLKKPELTRVNRWMVTGLEIMHGSFDLRDWNCEDAQRAGFLAGWDYAVGGA